MQIYKLIQCKKKLTEFLLEETIKTNTFNIGLLLLVNKKSAYLKL